MILSNLGFKDPKRDMSVLGRLPARFLRQDSLAAGITHDVIFQAHPELRESPALAPAITTWTSSESGQCTPLTHNLNFPHLEALWLHLLQANVPVHYLASCRAMFRDLPRQGLDLDALKFFLATGHYEEGWEEDGQGGAFSHDDLACGCRQ